MAGAIATSAVLAASKFHLRVGASRDCSSAVAADGGADGNKEDEDGASDSAGRGPKGTKESKDVAERGRV